MKATICYEIVMLVARTLNIILKIVKTLWNVSTSSGTDVGGARQYSFKFNFSLRIRTTLVHMYLNVCVCIVFMHVCVMYCMYVCMYVCSMCVYIYVCIHLTRGGCS